MLFYQIGELFQSYAVGKSRQSITALMDIRPDYANIEVDGQLGTGGPGGCGSGRRHRRQSRASSIPLDGVVLEGTLYRGHRGPHRRSPCPGRSGPGDEVISGCVNLTGLLQVRVTKDFE